MLRRTKIVATLGPASSDQKVLEEMIRAGVDLVRMNFSHGSAADHVKRAEVVRAAATAVGRTVGILADLQGPKIRVGKFENSKIVLEKGDTFILDAELEGLGNQQCVGLDYKELPDDVSPGSVLLLNDGMLEFDVVEVQGSKVICKVVRGGVLSNNKGINRKGGGLTAPALTEKDMEDIKTAALIKADYLAISFPRSGEDMRFARKLMHEAGGQSLLMAKIERAEAIPALADIIEASDAIMVARGDLSVEVGDAAVPGLQKRMIKMARAKNRLVITATQMMESMITNPIPTRAEVSDVANAVLDGTDAVMLSAETAVGDYPVETIEAMARICINAEQQVDDHAIDQRAVAHKFTRIDQSIAMSALFAASHFKVKAIVALTQSGSTALWMSRVNAGVPIFALTPVHATLTKVTLFSGVHPVLFPSRDVKNTAQELIDAEQKLVEMGCVQDGDLIVVTVGESVGQSGHTNTLKIVRIGDHHKNSL
ncbi:MAG TPA: pyruvate kinase [Gallionella sp.]|jgi:pyruvate kinase|nr:pyruvate kinase [Gallionella sp.]OGS68535.1 MAG: pyruvate kinase [Gallionellales bacterium GWA2_54_124]OGT17622.1 MAG: pyruvate kinase [Gallionellales bacterium RIFOXYD12_FULL_53_10]OGT22679.1 MAG: pyruvate kinase [Gallionellales bacterium RIFOXYD2_FULL_52_7]HCI54112.1 pyruvate kinase [Gallionella sp.]